MKIDQLINNIYYKTLVDDLYSFRTTDAHFHFSHTKPMYEIVNTLVTCLLGEINFFMSDKKDLEQFLSSQETLILVEQEMISVVHYRIMKNKAEQVNKLNGPTKMDLRANDSLQQKLDTIGLPNYWQNRNLDLLILRAKELLS